MKYHLANNKCLQTGNNLISKSFLEIFDPASCASSAAQNTNIPRSSLIGVKLKTLEEQVDSPSAKSGTFMFQI